MVNDLLGFLEGRTQDLRQRVRQHMADAAAREDYERAKEYRDALRWLETVDESQGSVEIVGTGDADAIGYARDGDDAVACCCAYAMVASWVASTSFWRTWTDESDTEILKVLVVRYYLPTEGRATRVALPFAPDDMVPPPAGRAGHPVARATARHPLPLARVGRAERAAPAREPAARIVRDRGSAPAIPSTRLAVTWGCRRCPAASCASTSRTMPARHRRIARLVRGGAAEEGRVPEVKIKGLAQQDDYAAIHEVVTRYVSRRQSEGKALPDLFVIDGGRGQLNAALDAARQVGLTGIPFVSLAKREEEVYFPDRDEPLRLSRRSPSLRLLQRARDEAHRFGLSFSRQQRSKRTITSELLNVPGIGANRRRSCWSDSGAWRASGPPRRRARERSRHLRPLAERILEHLKGSA
jgi:excinuclease ABC subunit C